MSQQPHIWHFSTVGGVKRVNLESGEDLKHLSELDKKLWTALSCPVDGLEIDRQTLSLIDTDKDGKIRVPEIIQAVDWVCSVLKDPNVLLKDNELFQLSYINENNDAGKKLVQSAKTILKNIGKEGTETLTVNETSDTTKIFAGTIFNGDGVITEDSTQDSEQKELILQIIESVGSAPDRSGKNGISKELLDQFILECRDYSEWQSKKNADFKNIYFLGENTDKGFQNFNFIRSKADDYFLRCRLAAFDAQSTNALNLQIERIESITSNDLSKCMDEIASYPLAKIEANKSLPMLKSLNPAWENAFMEFKNLTLNQIYPNKENLSENEWNEISKSFAPYEKWISEKKGNRVESIGAQKINEILSTQKFKGIEELIAKDIAVKEEADNIILVDQLVRYHRDIFTLLKNFVTFYDFYTPGTKAIFQAGTLYIDQRSLDLCIKVTDMAKHAGMVSFSGMYLIYCDCTSKSTNEKMTIVSALTNGDIDNLVVGKNALFIDRKGHDWDATVIKIIDNPISIRQAFFSPYRKVSRFIETQINKFASAQDEKVTGDMTKAVEGSQAKFEESKTKKEPPAPFDVGKFVGIFAAIGLALGALSSALAAMVGGFLGLVWWKMPIALAGLLLVISGPAMIIAFLKLRKRNLAPVLDANGWAINASAVVNIQFGNTLTHLAELPKGAKINLTDPFTKKKSPLLPALLILSILAGILLYVLLKLGYLHLPF